jgi:hypothetical protein
MTVSHGTGVLGDTRFYFYGLREGRERWTTTIVTLQDGCAGEGLRLEWRLPV